MLSIVKAFYVASEKLDPNLWPHSGKCSQLDVTLCVLSHPSYDLHDPPYTFPFALFSSILFLHHFIFLEIFVPF